MSRLSPIQNHSSRLASTPPHSPPPPIRYSMASVTQATPQQPEETTENAQAVLGSSEGENRPSQQRSSWWIIPEHSALAQWLTEPGNYRNLIEARTTPGKTVKAVQEAAGEYIHAETGTLWKGPKVAQRLQYLRMHFEKLQEKVTAERARNHGKTPSWVYSRCPFYDRLDAIMHEPSSASSATSTSRTSTSTRPKRRRAIVEEDSDQEDDEAQDSPSYRGVGSPRRNAAPKRRYIPRRNVRNAKAPESAPSSTPALAPASAPAPAAATATARAIPPSAASPEVATSTSVVLAEVTAPAQVHRMEDLDTLEQMAARRRQEFEKLMGRRREEIEDYSTRRRLELADERAEFRIEYSKFKADVNAFLQNKQAFEDDRYAFVEERAKLVMENTLLRREVDILKKRAGMMNV